MEIAAVPVGSDLLDQVWELYRQNASTLGFLPRGAMDEFAHAGHVLAATRGDALLGYAAWRRSRGDAVLVHLCVAEADRGAGCSEALLQRMVDLCRKDAAIRLRCRRDYVAANKVWPQLGFVVTGESVGRGADQAALIEWRRVNDDHSPLLAAIRGATPQASQVVAIDANVFFDLMDPEAAHHDESRALFADWLDDVDICVTQELPNEILRQADDGRRAAGFAALRRYRQIGVHPDSLDGCLREIASVLPPPVTESDRSDRRQLVHAWKGGARLFTHPGRHPPRPREGPPGRDRALRPPSVGRGRPTAGPLSGDGLRPGSPPGHPDRAPDRRDRRRAGSIPAV
jgi:GNAT superfamily N-acetyltransferase